MHYIPSEYEPCARNEHLWYEGTDPEWIPPFGLAGEVHICDRCTTVRRRGIDSLGRVTTRQYVYPLGYSMRGDERPSKKELRAEWFKKQKKSKRPSKAAKKAKKETDRHLKSVG